ncbi:hypothetical protein WMY93_033763 [Mugilogobius chulae]|uniref:DNA transposase THAP9 n=1 Tax=Mugilogobius chulae TaxID=88201 RepID=A0AAW0MJR8_9GOBI
MTAPEEPIHEATSPIEAGKDHIHLLGSPTVVGNDHTYSLTTDPELERLLEFFSDSETYSDTINEPPPPINDLAQNGQDHDYSLLQSPKSVKRHLESQLFSTEEKLDHCRMKLKIEQNKTRRLQKRVTSLAEVIKELKEKSLISTGCAEMMDSSFSGVTKELLRRMEKGNKSKVSEELRSFAMTLHFYSAKAYSYVRESFDLALPHPDTIRNWYREVSSDPGFTKASFIALQAHVQERQKVGKKTICALMLDEMAIRKHIEYSAGRFHRYVDLGCGIVDDSLPPARDALVVMVVAIDDSWKLPVAYFFIDSLTGEERANLVNECLCRLHSVGVTIVSLTCDGPSCHFSMLKALGANLDVQSMVPRFLILSVTLLCMLS